MPPSKMILLQPDVSALSLASSPVLREGYLNILFVAFGCRIQGRDISYCPAVAAFNFGEFCYILLLSVACDAWTIDDTDQ